MDNLKLSELKDELSKEWNKPKAQNIKSKLDKREARSYKKIKELQEKLNNLKHENKG